MAKEPLTKQNLLQMVIENNRKNSQTVKWLILEIAQNDYQRTVISNTIGKALREQNEELMNRLSDLL